MASEEVRHGGLKQYSVAVQAILSSAYHAVPVPIAEASIGHAALEALVQAKLLSCRPVSSKRPVFSSCDLF